jgi:oligoribonuclease NrnB/cAMP/cGMP phosphodiesterase (DHH superfamily)
MPGVKVFYHSGDLDGFCSGAIVKHKFPEAEMFPINYGDEFPWDEIKFDDVIYMVDFSLSAHDMEKLARFQGLKDCKASRNFFWIDHHKGIIDEMEKKKTPRDGVWIRGYQQSGTAACELTWWYLFGSPSPMFIRLLSCYDVWRHDDKEFDWDTIEWFQYGFKAQSRDPRDDMQFWENWFNNSKLPSDDQISVIECAASNGKTVQSYVEDRFKSTLKDRSYRIDWEGFKCLVVNSDPYIANFATRSKEFEGCDIAINYANKRGESWEVSLRAVRDDIDLSVLAKKYGGGGHKFAAGFNWESWILPWNLEVS